jgi:hypothetical protein
MYFTHATVEILIKCLNYSYFSNKASKFVGEPSTINYFLMVEIFFYIKTKSVSLNSQEPSNKKKYYINLPKKINQ